MPASLETRLQSASRDLWRFADCEFDDLRFELRVHGQVVELERKPLEVLRYLLSRCGEVVRKDELLAAVWPDLLVVDASLATAVSKLRKVLGGQEVIQTVSRVGYRIAVEVVRVPRPEPAIEVKEEATVSAEPAEHPVETPLPVQGRAATGWRRLLWGGIAAALVAVVSVGVLAMRREHPSVPQTVNVAILPFQNVSASGSLDYLRSALPDEIAHTLSAARPLTVRPLAVTERLSDPGNDFRKLGRELDVNRVVTGHYLIEGDRLHITMEAVDTAENRILWQDHFEIPSNNLLAMQERVAAVTHGSLAGVLGVQRFMTDTPPKAKNEEAYELYLKSGATDWDPAPNREGIALLRRAVLLDPDYAPAWGLLALRYYRDARFGGGGPEEMAFSDAAAEKELALNPDSLDAIAELNIHRTERGDLVKAHQVALELLRRRPEDPNLHHVLNYVERYGGSIEDAGRECELVVLLAAKIVWGSCATTFMELGNYTRAKDFLRKDLSSEWSKALTLEVLLREGKVEQALRIPAPQIPHWDSYKMLLACARHEPAGKIRSLASGVEVDDDPEVDYFFAGHLAYCGQTDAALRLLKIAIDRNYCSYSTVDKDPFFDGMRADPRFQKLRQAGMACHNDFVSGREKRQAIADSASRQRLAGLSPVALAR